MPATKPNNLSLNHWTHGVEGKDVLRCPLISTKQLWGADEVLSQYVLLAWAQQCLLRP